MTVHAVSGLLETLLNEKFFLHIKLDLKQLFIRKKPASFGKIF